LKNIEDFSLLAKLALVIESLQILSFAFNIISEPAGYTIKWYRIYQYFFIVARPTYILEINTYRGWD
jgi:hypothetical protein